MGKSIENEENTKECKDHKAGTGRILSSQGRAGTEAQPFRKKLMILSAPSGYGKTALMELYARSSEAPSVWYRLDGNDNTASLFLESFTVSLEAAVSGFSWNPEQVQRVQGLEHPLEEDDFYQRIGRELAYTLKRDLGDDPLDLMLDDSQTLDSRPVFSILSGLTDALPGNVRILISTRGRIPGFALRFLAAGEALVLSGGELAFSLEETAEVFSWPGNGRKAGKSYEADRRISGGMACGDPPALPVSEGERKFFGQRLCTGALPPGGRL